MAFPDLLVFTSISILIFLYIAYKLCKKSAFKLPPGPRPWPVIGNLYNIKPVRCRCFAEWSQAYGPIISVWFGSNLNVIVSNSELAREVLKENDQQLANRYRNRSSAKFNIYGNDLTWADYGPHFVKVRKICTLQLFSPKRLEALRPIREYEVTAMVESIFKDCTNPDNKGRSQVVRKYLGDVALNNISRIVLGKRFMNAAGEMDEEGKELESIVATGVKLATLVELAHSIPWWLAWILPLNSEALSNYEAQRDRFTQAIMNHHILLSQNAAQTNHHFVDALLTHKEEYGLSHDTIIGLLWNMISAGKDTSAITVEWALGELIKNPRVQQKAQEELDRIIGPNRVLTESDFQNLPYLQCIIKEALRLHPPTPLMLPHRPATDVKIGGYDVPMGSAVHVNVWALARDPAIWKSPLEFRPERFIEEDVDIKGHDFRLLPFGAGRRVCPGAQLGINMVTLMLGQLLHHFNWAPPEGVRPKEIDMAESPGLVSYMSTPLEAVPTPRLHVKFV